MSLSPVRGRPSRPEAAANASESSAPRWPLLVASAGVLAAVYAYDAGVLGIGLFPEGHPRLTAPYLFRSLLVALAGLLLVAGLRGRTAPGLPASRQVDGRPGGAHFSSAAAAAAAAVLVLSVAGVGLLAVDPGRFYMVALEDGVVEVASAVLLFGSGILFVFATRRVGSGPDRILAALAAAGLLLVGLEEVSWFQRVAGFDTPRVLGANEQGEANLHNLATVLSENVYYFGAGAFFAILPALDGGERALRRLRLSSAFLPSRRVAIVSASFVGYNYDMWNSLSIQLPVFASAAFLAILVAEARGTGRRVWLPLAGLVTVVSTQMGFLLFGNDMVRLWGATEYKELFIPVVCLWYAVETWQRLKPDRAPG